MGARTAHWGTRRASGWWLVFLIAVPLHGQEPQEAIRVSGRAAKSDLSPPLRTLISYQPATPTGLSVEIPIGAPPAAPSEPAPFGPPARTAAEPPPPAAPGSTVTPAVDDSFEGLSEDDNSNTVGFVVAPPDTNGDIGLDQLGNKIYIQYINLVWGIFDAAIGTLMNPPGPMAGNSFWSGFGGFCESTNDGDPLVLYDDEVGRWVFAQFVRNRGLICFALSTTADPLGTYHRYEFQVGAATGTADYPKLGIWAQGPQGAQPASANQSAYTFTSRNFPFSASAFAHSIVFERDRMLAGDATAQFVSFPHPCNLGSDCLEGQLPPHQAGPPPAFGTCPTFFAIVDKEFDDTTHPSDGVRLHRLCVDWQDVGSSSIAETFAASAVGFSRALGGGFSDCIDAIPPPGDVLDCLASFTMYRAQYRYFDGSDGNGTHASVVLNTTVDAGTERGGIHWMELRSDDGETGWSIFQEGTHAPADDRERWMGSIAQDGRRNIALGYSRTSATEEPSLYYTLRELGDAPGSMGSEEVCHDGTGVQVATSNRWGDYSSMSLDPEDDCTFWFTGEYYETTGSFDFKTRICRFNLCDNPPVVAITMPADGAEFDDMTPITFVGTATDDEDGDLSASLAWSSDLDGSIGSAGSFMATLSAGAHTIEASVVDSGGNPGVAQIGLTITSADCPAHKNVGPGTISMPETHRAVNTIDLVGGTTVAAGGELHLFASQTVAFYDGVAFEAGAVLEVVNTNDPCP